MVWGPGIILRPFFGRCIVRRGTGVVLYNPDPGGRHRGFRWMPDFAMLARGDPDPETALTREESRPRIRRVYLKVADRFSA